MFFRLPTSDVLTRAFIGARAWSEERQVASQAPLPEAAPAAAGDIDRPGKTFEGYTLYATVAMGATNTDVFLMNMRREVVHRWSVPFSRVWPDPPQAPGGSDSRVCVYGTHLYPNGDLLVVYHGLGQLANGYGLAKVDKDSNVIWGYPANLHHDVDVGEDGTIYAIQHELVATMSDGLGFIPTRASSIPSPCSPPTASRSGSPFRSWRRFEIPPTPRCWTPSDRPTGPRRGLTTPSGRNSTKPPASGTPCTRTSCRC
jgi:hypothetical protein